MLATQQSAYLFRSKVSCVFVALGATCIYSAPWAAAMVHLANGKEYANGARNGEQQGRPRLSAVTSACVHVLSFTFLLRDSCIPARLEWH